MSTEDDALLAEGFGARCKAAREHLRGMMEKLGMNERDGWRIGESVRQASGGSELVLRPLHRYLNAPPDMECIVWIDGGGKTMDMACTPPS